MESKSFLSRDQALSPEIRKLSQEERDWVDAFFAAQEILPGALIVPIKVTRMDQKLFELQFDHVREQAERETNFVFERRNFDKQGRQLIVLQHADVSVLDDSDALRIVVRPEVIIGQYPTSTEYRLQKQHYQQLAQAAQTYNNENNPNLN